MFPTMLIHRSENMHWVGRGLLHNNEKPFIFKLEAAAFIIAHDTKQLTASEMIDGDSSGI